MKKGVLIFLALVIMNFAGFSQWICGDTLIDIRDGKKYPTVEIGSQCWMAANLDIGTRIIGTKNPSDNDTIEKYCWGDSPDSCLVHGGLYTWDEMMDYTTYEGSRGICPQGWHIPSDNEIKELERALGMDSATAELANVWRGTDQGTQIKEGGSSGLEVKLSGARVSTGSYMAINSYAYIYSSTESGSNAWRRCLRTSDTQVGRFNTFPKTYGFSVRCVKDDDTTTVNLQAQLPLGSAYYYQEGDDIVIVNTLQYSEPVIISLFDITGKRVFNQQLLFSECSSSSSSIIIPASGFPRGLYIIHIQSKINVTTGKVVIQ